jgi:hypothetical protein
MRAPLPPVALLAALAVAPAVIALPGVSMTLAGVGAWLGWLGSGLIAASLLLMVREPAFAAWFGDLERMYRWHHGMGTLGYAVLLAHPVVLAAAALPEDPAAAWRVLSPAAQSWHTLLGWLALLALMAGLGATFAVRLPYSMWRSLHAMLGIGVLLGLVHALAIDGVTAKSTLVIAAAVIALGWRATRADRGGGARPYEVSAVEHPAPGHAEVTLRPLAAPITVAPGQFVMAAFFEGPHFRGCGEYARARHQGPRRLHSAHTIAGDRRGRACAGTVRQLSRRPRRGARVVDRRRHRHHAIPRPVARAAGDAAHRVVLRVSQR